MGRIFKCLLAVWMILGLAGCLGGAKQYAKHPSLPPYDGKLQVEGLQGPVDVYRDGYGIPHIFTDNEHDLFLAVGYVQAQDRLWEMVFLRAVAEGRTAELLGALSVPGVEFKGMPASTLGIDRTQRIFGLKFLGEVGAALLEEREPAAYAHLQAYSDGVNAFIQTHPRWEQLPVEFQVLRVKPEPWRPADCLSFGRLMGFMLGWNMMVELLRYGMAEKYGADLMWNLMPIHDTAGPTIVPTEMLQNKLAKPRALPPGGRPSDEELGLKLPLSGQAALKLFEAGNRLQAALALDAPLASNNWVVSGKLTKSGRPMLANDPHLSHMEPSIWYLMHLKGAGYDAFGGAFPGQPYVVLGHTRDLAWAATTSIADVQDLFVETVDPKHPGQYLYKGEWRPFTVRQEVIRVRGGRDRVLEVRQSIHGPIINDIVPLPQGTPPVAMRWTAWDFGRNLQGFEALIQARSVDEFMERFRKLPPADTELRTMPLMMERLLKGKTIQDFIAAVDKLDLPNQNWMAADSAGHIAYLPGGLVPIRNKGLGAYPVPGESGEFDWTGFIPLMELPHAIDPERGYMVSANNQVVEAQWYPYVFDLNYDASWRAWRIEDLIKEMAPLDLEKMKQIQNDVVAQRAKWEVPKILQAVENKHSTDPLVLKAADQLRRWNFETTLEATAPVIFFQYTRELRRNLLEDEVDKKDYEKFLSGSHMDIIIEVWLKNGTSPFADDKRTQDQVEDLDDMLVKSLHDAMAWVEAKYGPDPKSWEWGKLHWIKFYHPLGIGPLDKLSVGPFPHLGGPFTVRCATPAWSGKAPFKTLAGSTFKHLIELGDPDHAQMVIDGSESGQWLSPHYDDLHKVWLNSEYITGAMDPKEVAGSAKYHLRLTP